MDSIHSNKVIYLILFIKNHKIPSIYYVFLINKDVFENFCFFFLCIYYTPYNINNSVIYYFLLAFHFFALLFSCFFLYIVRLFFDILRGFTTYARWDFFFLFFTICSLNLAGKIFRLFWKSIKYYVWRKETWRDLSKAPEMTLT